MNLTASERNCATCGRCYCPVVSKGAWRSRHCSDRCRRKSARTPKGESATKPCQHCGQPFTYRVSRGTATRKYCGAATCTADRLRTMNGGKPLCVVAGCHNHRAYSSGLCNSCYYRVQRTGTVDRRQFRYRSLGSNGYVRIALPGHPLASKSGYVSEHRQVLYDNIGPGPHRCRWCDAEVDWIKGFCVKGALVPDHLDGDKTNNSIENLVASCNRCNTARGLFLSWVKRHKDDPALVMMFAKAMRDRVA